MSIFEKIFGSAKPSTESNVSKREQPTKEQARFVVEGLMRQSQVLLGAGKPEECIETLAQALKLSKALLGFRDPDTQLIVNEICLRSYDVGLKESGLEFETIRWMLRTWEMQDQEKLKVWGRANPSLRPDDDVVAHYEANKRRLSDLISTFWSPTGLS